MLQIDRKKEASIRREPKMVTKSDFLECANIQQQNSEPDE